MDISPNYLFLGDGGEMGERIRAYDWAHSPIGSPDQWPQSLKTAVRLVLTSRHPMFIWWGQELIQFYNDAYAETMGPERHPSALGDRGRDCWAEIWPIIGPQIDLVMRGEGSTWNDDQLVPITRHGGLRDVWWTYGYSPIDDAGGVGGVLVVCNDVTEAHLARDALDQRNAQLRSDVERLHELFVQAPGFVAILGGPEHVFEFTNTAYERLVGRHDLIGRPVHEVLPEIAAQSFVDLLREVYASGEPHVGTRAPLRVMRAAGAEPEQLYVDFVFQPIRDASGQVSGIFVEGHDVTARVMAEERQRLVVDEMNHRVKNILSTVQALAMLTGKSAKTVDEFRSALSDRIHAIATTQDLLIRGQSGHVDLSAILEAELAPYLGAGQVDLRCEPMSLAPNAAVSVGMLVHELLTNAAKYGALSTPAGRLSVRATHVGRQGLVEWRETIERLVDVDVKPGFGTRLIERLAGDLGGRASVTLSPTGLRADIALDLGLDQSRGAEFHAELAQQSADAACDTPLDRTKIP
ncbi:MAG: PAS domain-containing protein [Phenylobacterium sp.]|uniref:sensor histidine kinase n=1 Tax=Phenylobacterium sp. TaxID=1871053 RepID=UPI0027342D13|nr:PAS domain-containing protein [Phenylobacterium sp.]MDP3175103.1 PAS domain-containing protein [Phenylobacterium sp.]